MSEYDNEMRGILFKNDKQGNENRPDYTGRIQIDGKEWRLAAWIKDGNKGKFMSINVSEFQDSNGVKSVPKSDPFDAPVDADIPF